MRILSSMATFAAAVLISGCGAADDTDAPRGETTTAAPSRETADATGYRFVGTPIVIYAHDRPFSRDSINFTVYARLNRRRPIGGNLLLEGNSGFGAPFRTSTKRHCYSQLGSEDPPRALRYPRLRTGQRVIVQLASESDRVLAEAHVPIRRVTLSQSAREQSFVRRLGCDPLK